jgi:hypothetical protein
MEKEAKKRATKTTAVQEVQSSENNNRTSSIFEAVTGTALQVADYLNKLKEENKYPFIVSSNCVVLQQDGDEKSFKSAILDVIITRKK